MFDVNAIITAFGYLGVTLIIFAESGLFFGFFLPGDSLLFTAGYLASQGVLDIHLLVLLTTVAAISGDSVGYWFGKKIGPAIFSRPNSRFFSQQRVSEAKHFFDHHGARSIIIARFVPAVRTFVPIIAGVAGMHYGTFIRYNIIGGLIWGAGLPYAAYFLGSTVPHIDQYIEFIILGIVFVSVLPIVRPFLAMMVDLLRRDTRS